MQIAGVLDRHEPDHGEVNFAYVLSAVDDIGYDGWVGCEYRPAAATTPASAGRSVGAGSRDLERLIARRTEYTANIWELVEHY
jgi:sugar phosphate isomerase/epimerase